MKPIEQCITIAEACGYSRYPAPAEHCYTGDYVWAKHNEYPYLNAIDLPNYPRDLNAMHQAEKVLTEPQMIQYHFQLFRMAESPLTNKKRIIRGHFITCATAAQRAEAFLKTLNLWDNQK